MQWREMGKRKTAKFPSRDLAEQGLAKKLSDVALGFVGIDVPKDPSPPLGELAEAWIERRKLSNRSWLDDRCRWRRHCEKPFGKLRPDEVTPAAIRELVEKMLLNGFKPATCHRVVALVSSLFTDLIERELAKVNPAKALPRATRRLMRTERDPRSAPFLETAEDVRKVFLALPEPINVAFAVGALAGLRTGEVLGLRWANVDLERRVLHVCEQVQDGVVLSPKSRKSRTVPIGDSLLPVLKEAKLRSGGAALVVPPENGRRHNHLSAHTLGKRFKDALKALNAQGAGLRDMSWYQATRHTFGSRFVMGGGSLAMLKEILGHSTVLVTEQHYVHLRSDMFTPADLARVDADLSAPEGKVLPISSALATMAATAEQVG